MSSVSYQTIKLSRGDHKSPEEGACVIELASMLAGESFSDRPASVCPVIGSLLRAYNDSVDDDRRQELYGYAAKVVDSNRSAAVRRARADRLAAWTLQARERGWARRLLRAWLRSIGVVQEPTTDVLGRRAVRSMSRRSDEAHPGALELVDELLAIGASEREPTVRPSRRGGLATTPRG
jgi:hypothetical protein